ncbi:MAG: hypothetical protein J6T10_20975 [Methanobrevibacter sp.]|nr:hypothetical protein [Methanobrevibacter sp.]
MPDIDTSGINWNLINPSNIAFTNLQSIYGTDGTPRNLSTYNNNYFALTLIAQNRFKWESKIIKPFERLSEYIEHLLYYYGQCLLHKTGEYWEVLRCVALGKPDEFGVPTRFQTFTFSGEKSKIYDYKDVIWIKNNAYCLPTSFWIWKYCDRISHIERVMDLNIDAQKTPYIIETTPEMQFSVKNLFKKIKEMSEVIFTNSSAGGIREKVKVLDLNSPYLVDKLYAQKQNEFNDALNFIGINTIDEKRERLITGEAEIAEDLTEKFTNLFESPRRKAVEQFNSIAGDNALILTETGIKKTEILEEKEGA